MRILANPVVLRAAVVLFCSTFSFLLGVILIRWLRNSINKEVEMSTGDSPSLESLPLHVYNTVIQQLKQQKHELLVQSQAEQHRARTSETFSQAVLSSLPCGVLVFGRNGLVKTSNPSAKEILGFASTTGMGAADIFRGAVVRSAKSVSAGGISDATLDDAVLVADEVDAVLHHGSSRRQIEAEYQTPAGEKRFLTVTVSAISAVDGGLMGAACVINDRSELEIIRRQQDLQGEISAEMALQLRTSLATISGYAQQLASNHDRELARQLATDIAHEAAELDHRIGGFLTERQGRKGAAAAGSTD